MSKLCHTLVLFTLINRVVGAGAGHVQYKYGLVCHRHAWILYRRGIDCASAVPYSRTTLSGISIFGGTFNVGQI